MRYVVPVGTEVSVAKDDGSKRWQRFVTRKDTEFSHYVSLNSGAYVFQNGEWLMLVRREKVEHLG